MTAPRVRDANVPETPKTPATTTRRRDLGDETKSKVVLGLNKLATNKYPADDIFGTPVTAESVEKHALDTFGTVEKAEHWLNRPNPLFSGKTPRQVLRADPSWVEAALVRIDYGVYA